MNEYDWEPHRVPRTPRPGTPAHAPRRNDPVSHYVALELPRESATWLLHPVHRTAEPSLGDGVRTLPARLRAWIRPKER